MDPSRRSPPAQAHLAPPGSRPINIVSPPTMNIAASRRALSPASSLGKPSINQGPRRPSLSRKHAPRSATTMTRALSSSLPPIDNLLLLSTSASDAAGDDLDEEEVEERRTRPASKARAAAVAKASADFYQCEKCGKTYRHPACLTKHRWQHTEYWKDASKLLLSKHDSVQVLEAAAILLSPEGLPASRDYWPAAVSPPTSGLLGSEQYNLQQRASSFSPATGSLPLPSLEHRQAPEDDEDTSSESSGGMDLDSRVDDAELFDFEMEGENGSAGTSGPEDVTSGPGGFSRLLQPRLTTGPSPTSARYAAHAAQSPAVAYGVSAPPIGFFTVRNGPASPSSAMEQ